MSIVPGAAGGPPHVDLHAHSTASDGSQSPAFAVTAAHAAGVTAFALTDHDTLAGIAEAQRTADALGIRLVPGVELSVHQGATEVHLLGLHIRDVALLQAELEVYRGHRRSRAVAIVARLNGIGVPLTMQAVMAIAGDAALGRPHVAKALIAGGFVRDSREAFDRFLGAGRPAYVDKERLEIADGIALIHRTGGIAVLAHPGAEGRREWLEALVAVGLDGLEVLHPSHSADDRHRLGALADHLGLVPSGGSDWHGAMQGGRTLGALQVPLAWLDRQDARVRVVRGEAAA
ncbi:MAG: PHP domain-containing protein [Gemmatimonadaceae bacterium]